MWYWALLKNLIKIQNKAFQTQFVFYTTLENNHFTLNHSSPDYRFEGSLFLYVNR